METLRSLCMIELRATVNDLKILIPAQQCFYGESFRGQQRTVRRSSSILSYIFFDCNQTRQTPIKSPISHFTEIRSVTATLIYEDKRTDGQATGHDKANMGFSRKREGDQEVRTNLLHIIQE
jgi:hypothetical protein